MDRRIAAGFFWVKILENVAAAWFFSTYSWFLVEHGLELWQVSMVNVVFMSVSTVFDPITGNLADRWGQKRIYLYGLGFWGLGMMIYGFGQSFWHFGGAEAMAAVGHALMSEALETWLRNHCGKTITKQVRAKTSYWANLARIPTAILGGYVGGWLGLSWPWFLAGGSSMAALLVAGIILGRVPERPESFVESKVPNVIQVGIEIWKEPRLRTLVVLFLLTSACFQPINMYWPIVFGQASGQTAWLGNVWIVISLGGSVGSWLSAKWKEDYQGLAMAIVLMGLPIAAGGVLPRQLVPLLACLGVHEVGRGLWPLVFFNMFNESIDDQVRSSINSIRSSLGTLGGVIGLPAFGLLTRWLSPLEVWLMAAMALLMIAVYTWRQKC
jgi:MFS family permease